MAEHGVMYFVAKDITDRRATDIEQAQAASLARAITDSVTDGLLVADQDGAIVYVNPSGLAMLGFEGDELIGADRAATLREGETDDGSFARKDGSAVPVVSSSSPVALASGVGSVITFRDISAQLAASTARDDAEAGVRRSDELHRTLTANLPDTTVFLLDLDLRILIADGEAIRRLPWFDEALFRGRLVAELDDIVPDTGQLSAVRLPGSRTQLVREVRRMNICSVVKPRWTAWFVLPCALAQPAGMSSGTWRGRMSVAQAAGVGPEPVWAGAELGRSGAGVRELRAAAGRSSTSAGQLGSGRVGTSARMRSRRVCARPVSQAMADRNPGSGAYRCP